MPDKNMKDIPELFSIPVSVQERELITAKAKAANLPVGEYARRAVLGLTTARHEACVDPLTGLGGRPLLDERIEHGMARARRHNTRMALMLVRLDGLDNGEDETVTGKVLVMAAERLTKLVRAEDTVAKLSGSDFALVLEEVFETDDIARVAAGVTAEMATPFAIDGNDIHLGASIGPAFFPDDGATTDDLFKVATRALPQEAPRLRITKPGKR